MQGSLLLNNQKRYNTNVTYGIPYRCITVHYNYIEL